MPIDTNDFDIIINASDGDPRAMIRLLAGRVKVLTLEKEQLEAELDDEQISRKKDVLDHEERLKRIENMVTMGRGAMLVIPLVGAGIAWLIAKGSVIFAPWNKLP